jgi:hypothetical protein
MNIGAPKIKGDKKNATSKMQKKKANKDNKQHHHTTTPQTYPIGKFQRRQYLFVFHLPQ